MAESGKPDAFLVGKEPPVPWNQWKKTFVVYTQRRGFQLKRMQRPAPGGDAQVLDQQPEAYSHIEKNLDLYALLGTEGQRLFNGTPDSDNFDRPHEEILELCDKLFHVRVNTLLALHRFRKREQRPNESASDFAAELRVLAKDCNFNDANQENAEIAQTLVLNCHDQTLKERLFEKYTEQTPLQDILNYMNSYEQAKSDVKQLQHGVHSNSVALMKQKPNQQRKWSNKPNTTSNGTKSCMGCGRQGHDHGTPSCPAFNKKCRFCNTDNHFDNVCLKKKHSRHDQKKQASLKHQNLKSSISSMNSKIYCTLQLRPVRQPAHMAKISLIVDTGADASTMTESLYRKHFSDIPLENSDISLHNFDDSEIVKPLGAIRFFATYPPDHSAEVTFQVVHDRCLSVLGIDEMSALSLRLDMSKRSICVVNNGSDFPSPDKLLDSLEKEFPHLFSAGIGKVPGYQHKIQLKEGAQPRRFKLRHPPVAIREKAKEAMEELFKYDIIEKAETSEYVHPVHFVWKSDGSVRTTVDFSKGLNEDIIPASHPLPLPSDIFNMVGDDKFFSKLDLSQAYHHIEIAVDSRPLTAFLTESHGLCQFKRLPMGMTDSGAVFQRQIEKSVAGITIGPIPSCLG